MGAFIKLEDLVEVLRIDIDHSLEPQLDPNQCCIFRVPEDLRSMNEKAYAPQLVSIGPLHHGKIELAKMEKTKRKYMKSFLERITVVEKRDVILNFIKDKEKNVRNCYAETSTLGSIEYIMMILYDAIFVIELLLRCRLSLYGSDFLLSTLRVRQSLCRDFQLLENQLPYFVLNEIYELAFVDLSMPTLKELLCYFFGSFNGLELSRSTPQVVVKNLTDWRRTSMLRSYQRFEKISGQIYNLPGAMQLNILGVKFKCVEARSLIDIRLETRKQLITCFEVHEIQIPHLKIFDDTESLLRNVMALEQCHYPSDTQVCNYVMLINHLIKYEYDVEFLVGNGIISNYMGDNASVVNMFNKLGQFIFISNFSYYDICEEVKRLCNNPWNRRIATYNRAKAILKTVYFNHLWRGTATVGAVLLLLLTIIQAICSILQVVFM